jgi:uncharacterized protein (TIGR02594 family)
MDQPRWLEFAWGDLGVAEAAGAKSNPNVVRYYAEVGHAAVTDDEVAWCAAFLGACLERVGIRSTRSLLARSYLSWGEALSEPRNGAIAVLSRGFDPRLGHVGFLVGITSNDLILLGGNQGDAVRVQAFPRSRLLGLRWPIIQPTPTTPVIPEAQGPRPEAIRDPAPTADPLFEQALAHVLKMEGGYDDDPYDPGGPTNLGITIAVYARYKGVELTADNIGALKSELKQLPVSTARQIYRDRYWLAAACPQLPSPLALFHFDTAVNHGVDGAARMLQQAVGVDMDGEIGPATLAAAGARPIQQTLAAYAEIRRQRYRSLAHFWRFGKGWLARVDATLALATSLSRASPSTPPPLPSQPKEKPMSTETDSTAQPATDSDPKWWAHSMTIWGVIVTTLSTVLPAIGPALGLNITADLIQQLGDNVVVFGQALGGLVGTVLAIYGRVRASAPLQRRQVTLNL